MTNLSLDKPLQSTLSEIFGNEKITFGKRFLKTFNVFRGEKSKFERVVTVKSAIPGDFRINGGTDESK
jgi:hypothetical protein